MGHTNSSVARRGGVAGPFDLQRRLYAPVLACLLVCCSLSMPSSAFALTNPERHYEMVSPAYKGGYGVLVMNGVSVAGFSEGDRTVFESLGNFAGAPNNIILGNKYLSVRSSSGWSTVSLILPSTTTTPYGNANTLGTKLAPSLESVLFEGALSEHSGEGSTSTEEGPFSRELLVQRLGEDGSGMQVVDRPFSGITKTPMSEIQPNAVSPDLCHMVIVSNGVPLLAEAKGLSGPLYELSAGSSVAGCGGEAPSLRLLALEEGSKGEQWPMNPYCVPLLAKAPNAISADGQTVFFQADPNLGRPSCDYEQVGYVSQGPLKLFVRLNGERTVEVSRQIPADCAETAPCGSRSIVPQRAVFSGANEAGTRVFFTTVQPLVTGDTEFTCRETTRAQGNWEGLGEFETQPGCETGTRASQGGTWKRFGSDIYMASLECPGSGEACPVSEREVTSLTQVSRSVIPGEAGEVQGERAMVVSKDGSRVYFVAGGVLTEGANREGRVPAKGAANLYVYDVAEGRNHFVTNLCSGLERSGEVVDQACPEGSDSGYWMGGASRAEATGDGEFLVFTSYGQLVPGDVDTAEDIYRYDAATETLARVSVGENGADRNGNNSAYNVELPNLSEEGTSPETNDYLADRAISEDGSRIVFGSSEMLSSKALISGVSNVYEWHEGHVSLISTGTSTENEGLVGQPAVITPSGRDVFFISSQNLVHADTDGLRDVYDARTGEGFPAEPESQRQCEGDACQGMLTNPAPLLIPGSVVQAPGENSQIAAKTKVKSKKRKASKKPRKKVRKRKHPAKTHGKQAVSGKASKASRRGSAR